MMIIQSIHCSRRKLFVAATDVLLLPNAGDCLLGSLPQWRSCLPGSSRARDPGIQLVMAAGTVYE